MLQQWYHRFGYPRGYQIQIFSFLAFTEAARRASKVLASMYWRSKIQGRNFGLKLKFYYTNRQLGTRHEFPMHQNLNWTPNETSLLVKLDKLVIFGIFNNLLSTQNVNVARSARIIECDFFYDFQALCKVDLIANAGISILIT